MARKNLGIYLGVNSIGAVLAEAKRALAAAKFDLSSLEEDAQVETLSEDVKWEALINKTLRQIHSDEKDVSVALGDRDFIFRSFEMPMMNKNELSASLMYEIEKHIPFKVTELIWDYSYARLAKEKKLMVCFIGIKQENYRKVQTIFSHLDLTPTIIEPACIALVRTLKSVKKYSGLKNFAVLDLTRHESYLTFFYNELPVFNRYLAVEQEGEFDTGKYTESVRLSFQYFLREFRAYSINKLVVVTDTPREDIIAALKEDLQLDISAVLATEIDDRVNEVEGAKALGTAGRETFPYKFSPELQETKEEEVKIQQSMEPTRVGINYLAIGIVLGVGILASVLVAVLFSNVIFDQKLKLNKMEAALNLPEEFRGLSWEDRAQRLQSRRNEVTVLRRLQDKFKRTSSFFNNLPDVLPDGIWLNEIRLTKRENGYQGSVSGFSFLGDSLKERVSIDEFVRELREHNSRFGLFGSVEMVSSTRNAQNEYEVTSFEIRMEEK
ncbi:MAG: hypothetical protein GF333_06270 [Candidatus Omnitrophica bacterium]|nr:hypothetical protein [Candidatus Omnitrophota bacterium]